jgi:ubiquitin carboxyl-terminal hydrolase 4/11/15
LGEICCLFELAGYVEKTMRKLYEIPDEVETRIWNCYYPNEFEQLTKEESTVQDAGLSPKQLLVIETRSEDGSWNRQTKKYDPCKLECSN